MDRKLMNEYATKAARDSGGGGWLKVQPGETAELVLLGEPECRVIVWDDGQSRPADREDVGSKVSKKALQTVYNLGAKSVQIWETSLSLWKSADDLKTKLPRWSVELTRTGSGLETRWDVKPGRELTPDEIASVKSARLPDQLLRAEDTSLEVWESWVQASKAPAGHPAAPPPPPADEDIPF